ncbi:hypothetical protein BT93_K0496 [Corymbia citriodora subsp. variegata]|nr:hypothetical protein BT93_K0496 [Corymbia citriodora subsp. variegata]KAF8006218.1 hypothetical protein BT93_K0496 [Corymbia citriodora subsp. variegata]KAF8006219.1 hypothetical protein BT93_K0496 [Corymbia citriodora subsp. variegata]
MAQCAAAAAASCARLHLRRGGVNFKRGSFDQKLRFRRHGYMSSDVLNIPRGGIRRLSIGIAKRRLEFQQKASSVGCHSVASLVDFDGATASEFTTMVDQALLMASILLTYMAGVVPIGKPRFSPRRIISDDDTINEGSTLSGSDVKVDDHFQKCAWDVIKGKLIESLEAIDHASVSEDKIQELEKLHAKKPLSLNAIAWGPRLQLVWAVLTHLEKEVDRIPEGFENGTVEDWLVLFSGIIQSSSGPVCVAWLDNELSKRSSDVKEALVTLILQKLEGDSTVLQKIRRLGKEDLFAELLCFLKFGSLRKDCYYNSCLFVSQGISILEDLVIAIADDIASIYLELISVDGNLSNEMNNLDLALCSLSTRALQRLRNEVAMNLWLHQNIEAVVSMYEDRFDLHILQSQPVEEPSKSVSENLGWWDKYFGDNSRTRTSSLHHVVIGHFSMPVKRTKELRALRGWRYYFSLFLELSDITTPVIRTFFKKVSDAVSFFLVCLIGRSLGLIYTGIRQSLRWK